MNSKECYDKIQGIIKKHTIGSRLNWPAVCNELSLMDNPVMPDEELNYKDCNIEYGKRVTEDGIKSSPENQAWTYSFLLIGWVLHNFREKTNDGHCHNTNHEHGDRLPRKCKEGSKFHNDLFEKCFNSFKDILDEVEKTLQN